MAKDLLGVPCAACAVIGRDGFHRVLPFIGIRRRGEALEELALQLSLPLHHERGRREDQHTTRESSNEQLLEDDPRLDGLTESDLVGEDGAPSHLSKDAARDLDLMGQLFDRVGVEGDEAIEARRQRNALGFAADVGPETGARWLLEPASEFGQRALVDGPKIVFGCCGSGHR